MPVQLMNQQQRKAHPLFQKMNAEEETLTINQRLDLVASQPTVSKLMGPEPIPSLDIQMDEIQNELQRKMVEEIQCVVCFQFPYKPQQCKKCNKLFCKYCQIQITKGSVSDVESISDINAFQHYKDMYKQIGQQIEKKLISAGRDGRGTQKIVGGQKFGAINDLDTCCPSCQERGDFLEPVNKVLQNCIDFCEFPHRCYQNGKPEVIWKTLGELQVHAQFHCPKFGCDICYREEFQHLTRAQLHQHVQIECPDMPITCQVCNRDYIRAEFAHHQCIKDFYIEKLNTFSFEVIEHLADKLIMHQRQKDGLGMCAKVQCIEKHRQSNNHQLQSMIAHITEVAQVKCFKCKIVVNGNEDSYACIYCNETYCPTCLGYSRFYELEEMEQLLLKANQQHHH